MGRVSQEIYEEQLAETEQAIVRLRSAYRVEQYLAKKFKVNPRTARRWIEAVRKRWRACAVEVDKDAHRDDIAATLNEVIFQAMNKSFIVKNDDGTVVVDTNPNSPGFGKPIVKQNPDLQRVLHGIVQLRALYGVDAPSSVNVRVSKDIDAMPDLTKLPADGVTKLEEFLKTVSPDGDISKLAGEWFDFGTTPTEPTEPESSGDK